MTVPMDNSKENPPRHRVQLLFNKNVELENKRRKAAQARVPSDPSIWQQMRENYETIILEDHAFSEKHEVEFSLWQLHYRRIEELRALFNAAIASAGSAAPQQNGKGPARSGPDRIAKIRSQFKTFLSEASGFYHDLMLKIKSKYGLPLGYLSDDPDNQIPSSKNGNGTSEVKKGLTSCHRCLIYLGDLARYKGLYGEGDSKAREFVAASSYYMQASSIWPSSGNPHHQLAILAGYSNDELVSIYRYFRSLAVENPFVTARDNLIIAFEKNRQNHSQLVGDAKVTAVKTAPSRMADKGRGKGETRASLKDKVVKSPVRQRPANPSELLKAFITRFIRLNGVLFSRTSLETFSEVFSMVKHNLIELLSNGPNEEFRFGSDAAECRLAIVRMTAILIFTVHNVNKENENQSYADILQRSVLLQNAFTASFEFMGCILDRCTQLSDPSSSYLLPGVMVFVEWLACCHDIAVGSEMDDKQVNARSFFWNKCISLLNMLLSSGYSFINDDEDETCFSNMSKYDETETDNRLALPEDSELRGFIPLLPAQSILDFSRKHSFGGDGGKKEKIARVHRIVAAGKALANIVKIGQEGVYFDSKMKKFMIGTEPQVSDDYLPNVSLSSNFNGGKMETTVLEADDEEDDEVIVFKPPTNEKRIEEPYPKMTSGGDFGKMDLENNIGPFSGAHDSFLMQSALTGSMRTSSPVANGTSQYPLPIQSVAHGTSHYPLPIQSSISKWPVEQSPVLNGLSHFMENGLSLKNETQGHFGVSQPAAFSVPFPPFVSSSNVATQIPQNAAPSNFDSFLSSMSANDNIPFTRPSSTVQADLKKNPVSRPVRHVGPPPGFGSVRSKAMDESPNNKALTMDDYSWLDGYNLSSFNQSVGFANSINQLGPAFHTVSKIDSSIAGFPFPGKQASTLHVQNELQNGWVENTKMHGEQQENFKRGSQQPVGTPQQYQGQSLWEGRFLV